MPRQMLGQYSIYNTIGRGRFSKIRYAEITETREQVAIKSIDTTELQANGLLDDVKKEIAVMKFLNHENILGVREIFATHNRIFLVQDYMNGRNMHELLVQEIRLNESSAKYYFQQIVDGIEYMHSVGITHGNLRLDCLLLNRDGHLKISDFSKSNLQLVDYSHDDYDENASILPINVSTAGMDPTYFAPEIINKNCVDRKKVDMWMLGVMLFTMIAGVQPFQYGADNNVEELEKSITSGKFRIPNDCSHELSSMIHQLLEVEASKRINFAQINVHIWLHSSIDEVNFQEHPYVGMMDCKNVLRGCSSNGNSRSWICNPFSFLSHSSSVVPSTNSITNESSNTDTEDVDDLERGELISQN